MLATNLKAALALRGSFLLSMAFMVLNNLTFFVFWWVLLKKVGQVGGWRIEDVELLFGVSATSYGLMVGLCGGVVNLSRFIEEGALDPLLVQPKPTLAYVVGMRSQASGFGDMLSGIGLMALSGYLTWESAPRVVLCVLAAAFAFLGSAVVFFSLAFWLDRSHVLSRWLLDVTITFSLYPESLFGGAIKLVLFTLLPAGFVSYLPVQVIREASLLDATVMVLGAGAYVWIATRVFERGLARYSSGSRFGVFG